MVSLFQVASELPKIFLSDYADKKADFSIDPEVARILKEFNENKKPIGLSCIAPIFAAKLFENY